MVEKVDFRGGPLFPPRPVGGEGETSRDSPPPAHVDVAKWSLLKPAISAARRVRVHVGVRF